MGNVMMVPVQLVDIEKEWLNQLVLCSQKLCLLIVMAMHFNLSAGDTIKCCKIMKDALDIVLKFQK